MALQRMRPSQSVDSTLPEPTSGVQQQAVQGAGASNSAWIEALRAGAAGGAGLEQTTLPFQGSLESTFGASLGFLDVYQGPETELHLDELGADAAEMGENLLLRQGADEETVAHEVAHGLQRQRGSGSRTIDGGESDPAERGARLAASAVKAGIPAQVQGQATSQLHRTPEGEDATADTERTEVTTTLLYMQHGEGLLVIRAPASNDDMEIQLAFDQAGATACSEWSEVQPGDATYPLFYALLKAQEAGPSAIDTDALRPSIEEIVGPMVAGLGMAPGPWAPPGNQPIPFYIGNASHAAIAQAYKAERGSEIVFTNFTPISSIVEKMAKMGMAGNPDALSESKGALRPDILNASEGSIYEIKPEAAQSAAIAEASIYIAAFAEAGIVITLGSAGAAGTAGVLPAPSGYFRYWSPAPGAIVYKYSREEPDRVPVTVPQEQEERVQEPQFDPFAWEYWEEVTGLTGTALLIYLIVSEGSRILPARNLVPVP